MSDEKQPVLKPQDLIVAVKLATSRSKEFTLSSLAVELGTPVANVHGSIRRAEVARLISRSSGSLRAIRTSVLEFLIHGVKYAFPALPGPTGRGMPTSTSAPVFSAYFEQGQSLPTVWPDPHGDLFGPVLLPLHHSVPAAAKTDRLFYDAMALLDAIRTGAARERELAVTMIQELIL